ncbi:LysR family transcriptional regulator [Undibacterium terreum]|uniref:Transcriptional regulator n=1 Tax=Undibacterium terreum TaxID=1224302 RepID=A0A916USM0_9BURK|nr:LysR family transcriptional regulator [Undibacterium terreum]GGC85368.1 transcriptional regulator [Undibacterium terreum]
MSDESSSLHPHITLEQWRALTAVVETGGYAQAAELLHKSQSSVTYAVQKLESLLDVRAFEIQGRKAMLTSTGQLLYRRAKNLLDEAGALERAARRLSAGWEAEIRISAEMIFPTWLLLDCLQQFGLESPHTRIELIESVLAGTSEALLQGQADLAISAQIPPGFLGAPLMQFRAMPVASPDHPLHRLGRELNLQDLRDYRQLVIRETDSRRASSILSLDASQRWTVSHSATAIDAICRGYGFAWFPEEKIRDELATGRLKVLPLADGGQRFGTLYLILADPDYAGPAAQRLAQIIRETVASECLRIPGAAMAS